MLNRDQIELIHREIDGANSPEESAAVRSLMGQYPEARALAAELRHVTRLLDGVGEREPPPHLKRAILEALPQPARAVTPRAIVRWFVSQLSLVTARMEDVFMARKTMIYGGAALAIVVVAASLVTGVPPTGGGAGTIGGGDIPGVQQASRYRGRTMTQADVTLANPEIKALLQNDQILRLLQSDALRQVMGTAAFRELQASAVYRELQASEAFRELQATEAFRELMSSAAFRELQASEAFRELSRSAQLSEAFMSEAMRVSH